MKNISRRPIKKGKNTFRAVAAFFDVDGTLLKENTSVLFLKHFYRDRKINMGFLLKAVFYSFLHKLNCLTFNELSHFGLGFFKGRNAKSIKNDIRKYFEEDIRHKILHEMIDVIALHKEKHHLIILLTSSPSIIAERFKEYLGADYSISSIIESRDGKITGKFSAICYKDDKYRMFKEFSESKNIDLEKSYFYTDSISDLKVLESVGHPVAVNPRKDLKKIAAARKWEIIESGD
jgi:HAD superfamily hydrolase (TIGR01490 family)